MHDTVIMAKLITYIEQIESYADQAGLDVREISKDIGYENNIYRWLSGRFSPREAQAQVLMNAISERLNTPRKI